MNQIVEQDLASYQFIVSSKDDVELFNLIRINNVLRIAFAYTSVFPDLTNQTWQC